MSYFVGQGVASEPSAPRRYPVSREKRRIYAARSQQKRQGIKLATYGDNLITVQRRGFTFKSGPRANETVGPTEYLKAPTISIKAVRGWAKQIGGTYKTASGKIRPHLRVSYEYLTRLKASSYETLRNRILTDLQSANDARGDRLTITVRP